MKLPTVELGLRPAMSVFVVWMGGSPTDSDENGIGEWRAKVPSVVRSRLRSISIIR